MYSLVVPLTWFLINSPFWWRISWQTALCTVYFFLHLEGSIHPIVWMYETRENELVKRKLLGNFRQGLYFSLLLMSLVSAVESGIRWPPRFCCLQFRISEPWEIWHYCLSPLWNSKSVGRLALRSWHNICSQCCACLSRQSTVSPWCVLCVSVQQIQPGSF